MLSPYVFVCVRMCLGTRVGYGPPGIPLCCVFRRALILGGCLVILRFVFLVPCLGGLAKCATSASLIMTKTTIGKKYRSSVHFSSPQCPHADMYVVVVVEVEKQLGSKMAT